MPRFTLIAIAGVLVAAAAAASPAAAAPSCAEGPQTVGSTIVGTPCDDVIHAAPDIAAVYGGAGDDTIVPGAITAAASCPEECRLGIGSQTFDGGPGDDVVFGERGNDTLNGGEGNDRLYGGIGDDLLRGGPGNDLLSGGHGFDSVDGDAGNDYVRGDGTIDRIYDTGGGEDTLSYASGVTPGFGGSVGVAGFPSGAEGRGVRLELGASGLNGDNGTAPFGGGVDEVEAGAFEKVIGTPFSDYVVGSEAGEVIYGGGGADVILGQGGNDTLFGGAEGDDLDGGGGANSIDGGPGEDHCQNPSGTNCEPVPAAVVPRDSTKIAAGSEAGGTGLSHLYLVASSAKDVVAVSYSAGPPPSVTFQLGAGSAGFDESPAASEGCSPAAGSAIVCALSAPLDSIVLAGLGGNDELEALGFPSTVSAMLLGGEGSDRLEGGEQTEDVLVDGPGGGSDTLEALGRDDALMHNGGADVRLGGDGNDLFLSNSICDGDVLNGGEGRDNSSWTKLTEPVGANLALGKAGRPGSGEAPSCGGESLDTLEAIEDLEGTSASAGDVFYGDAMSNQLLGWAGPDSYFAAAGDDRVLANSGDTDLVIDCGEGNDVAFVDEGKDPPPVGCENVNGAEENEFREETLLPPPQSSPLPGPTTVRDTTPPVTRIVHRPPATVLTRSPRSRHRTVAFYFASNEPGSTFRCRLDRGAYRACRSPRLYTVGLGRHVVRVFAVDAAGNRDPTPAIVRFRVRRR